MKRKYLDDIGMTERPDLWNDKDKRQKQWKKERSIYGFDERETWALDHTFYCWLYERLRMYVDITCVNLEYHKFEYEGEILTQQECIDRMIKGCEIAFKQENDWDIPKDDWEAIMDVGYIWALVLPAMWW